MNHFILFFSFFLYVSSALAADYDNSASNIARTRHKTLGRRQGTTAGTTTCTSSKTNTTIATPSAAASKPSIRAAWVADWVPLDNVTWESYTMLTYAFGVTTPDPTNITVNNATLHSFVKTAKEKNVKAFLSLGGSQGSLYFSPHCATAESRTTFVQTIVKLVTDYGLDGIDFDWEFPNGPGLPCNKVDANDTDNYVALLKELRKALDSSVGLSAAVGMVPFNDKRGKPRTDVSDFAEVLDHVAIMAYDVFGSWSKNQTGPNAPLTGHDCLKSAIPSGYIVTAEDAIGNWTKANMPSDKIVLGVAAYGRSFGSLQGSLEVDDTSKYVTGYPRFGSIPQGYQDIQDGDGPPDACGANQTHSGVFTFEGLIDVGYLDSDGVAADNKSVGYVYDNCTQTPFLEDKDKGILISYDDPRSFGEKGRWIVEKELAGFAMWHAANDYRGLLARAVGEPFSTS